MTMRWITSRATPSPTMMCNNGSALKPASLVPAQSVECLYRRYRAGLLRHVTRILRGDRERAQEAVQTTFLRACIHEQTLTGMVGERVQVAWLYRVATNLALDYLRQRGYAAYPALFSDCAAQTHTSEQFGDESSPDELAGIDALAAPAWSPAPVDLEQVVLLHEAAAEALQTLSATQRQTLVLSAAGYSSEEVASLLRAARSPRARTASAVKMQQLRARTRVRELQGQHGLHEVHNTG